jgi:hypothetical protein
MYSLSFTDFDCQMYVSPRGVLAASLPAEAGPKRIASLEPMPHDKLIDPSFRRLLAAFESVRDPQTPLQTVQV